MTTTTTNNNTTTNKNKNDDDDNNKATLTPDQIEFTNAFYQNRITLAGFAKCYSIDELHLVRDSFFLGMARDLQLPEYTDIVQRDIVMNEEIAQGVGNHTVTVTTGTATNSTDRGMNVTALSKLIEVARTSAGWSDMVQAVSEYSKSIDGSSWDDLLKEVWQPLEDGRMEWLRAMNGAHSLHVTLVKALNDDVSEDNDNKTSTSALEASVGDVSDGMMIWMYAMAYNLPSLQSLAIQWAKDVVRLDDPQNPLRGYQAELWDPRHELWRPIDVGVQVAAERAGTSVQDSFKEPLTILSSLQ